MYSVYLSGVRLPVTPSKISMKIKNMNKTISLLEGGEMPLLKTPGLTEVEFEALIPKSKYPFAVYENVDFEKPEYYLSVFEKLKTEKRGFYFLISRLTKNEMLFETNMCVSLEEYQIDESAELGGDFLVKVKLRQYRHNHVRKIVLNSEKVASITPKEAGGGKKPPKSYTVKSGDTLWAICRRILGDGNKYPKIAKLNNIPNPNLIFPGQVIKFE